MPPRPYTIFDADGVDADEGLYAVPVLMIFGATSLVGQTQKSGCSTGRSALPSITDIVSQACQVRKVPKPEVTEVFQSPRRRSRGAKAAAESDAGLER